MIAVKKVKNDVWRECLNCKDKEEIYDIEIGNRNQGVVWCLCKKCLDEINNKVSEFENENQ